MTPKLQALPKALGMLRHSIEHDADKLYDRISQVEERKTRAFTRSHGILDVTEKGIGEVEQFVEELEKATNAGPPLDDSSPSSEQGPRSSELTDTARKVA